VPQAAEFSFAVVQIKSATLISLVKMKTSSFVGITLAALPVHGWTLEKRSLFDNWSPPGTDDGMTPKKPQLTQLECNVMC